MADLNWARQTLALMDEHLSEHGADIRKLRAASVPNSQVRALYPVEPAAYWPGISRLITTPKRGPAVLAAFSAAERDVLTTAGKCDLLGDAEQQAALYAELEDLAERATLTYPRLSVVGSWSSILALYGFPTVLQALLTTPAERWANWPPKNLAYLFKPFTDAAHGLSTVLSA